MKKRTPLRSLVTTYVAATHIRPDKKNFQKKTPREKLIEFFENLEHRGPVVFKGQSLFEKWTSKVRADMIKKKTWITNPNIEEFEFVAEYVSRLQYQYKIENGKYDNDYVIIKGKRFGLTDTAHKFRAVYLAIRVWGLRTKRFRLKRWLKRDNWAYHFTQTTIWPVDFAKKYNAKEYTFKFYVFVSPEGFYRREDYFLGNKIKRKPNQ